LKVIGKYIDRLGEKKLNKNGQMMEIIKYKGCNDILVRFEDGTIEHSMYQNFVKGNILNRMLPTICGVGYIGQGDYKALDEFGNSKRYDTWKSMIYRCYNKNRQKDCPTYKGCSVCEEWHNFQNFAKWYNDNYYKVEDEKMELDKDILIKGNKIYSPDTCIYVPSYINQIFKGFENNNNNKVSTGISKTIRKNKNCVTIRYLVYIWKYGKSIYFGSYENLSEAKDIYIKEKTKHILEIANKYKDKIPIKLYSSMCSYMDYTPKSLEEILDSCEKVLTNE